MVKNGSKHFDATVGVEGARGENIRIVARRRRPE